MKIKTFKNIFFCSLLYVLLSGCTKNETHYYPDTQTPGVSIFSNAGNNVFSCLLDGQPWKTIDRKIGGFSPSTYEISIYKQYFDSLTDQLLITWYGDYGSAVYDYYSIQLVLSVDKSFGFADFSALQGKRLLLDGIQDYVLAKVSGSSLQGSGVVYFNTAQLDLNAAGNTEGRLSGLLQADFGSMKLTSGRFDHSLEGPPIFFQ